MNFDSDPSRSETERLAACEQVLGYKFKDQSLLKLSLTHASVAPTRLHSNERMEFLGDSVLGMVVCDRLFARFPEDEEGQLTELKSEVVSRSACAHLAESLGLIRFVYMGKGLHQANEVPSSVLAGVFESIIAAIYLDGGFEAAYQFISSNLDGLINHAAETAHSRNSKSKLQQWTQKELGLTPTYKLLSETGPDHSKNFQVSAIIGENSYPSAWGLNKKEAEQKAALNALRELQGKSTNSNDSDT